MVPMLLRFPTTTVRTFLALAVGSAVTLVSPASAATGAQVDAAIAKGKEFLYNELKNGTWEVVAVPEGKTGADVKAGQWGGLTAIATYALLATRENPNDPRLKEAIAFLNKAEISGIYALGLRAQIWHLLPDTPEARNSAKRDAQLLSIGMGKKPPNTGFYSYNVTNQNFYHHSTAQYGVLGMWACEQAGVEVPNPYWQTVEDAWKKTQQPDGGWSYKLAPDDGHPTTASMTAAGVATLFITQDYLRSNEGISCRPAPPNVPIDKGMAWLTTNFDKVRDMYTWYGIERIGVASGYKFFGTTDWYTVGADTVLKQQGKNGAWSGHGGNVPATAFALLFLSRGGAPVVMNKLQYATGDEPAAAKVPAVKATVKAADKPVAPTATPAVTPTSVSAGDSSWNQRPRDAANVVRWMGEQVERDLNWQIVNLTGTADQLLDAPILYLAGSKAPRFTDAEKVKLKQYVEMGGMILGQADCAAPAFAEAFRKLAGELFPIYEWRELPAEHVIYTDQQFPRSKWKQKLSVLGVSNGVRELMVLIPQADPAKAWQMRTARGKEESFQLMANIFQYTIDKEHYRGKGDTFVVLPDAKVKATRTIRVARLKYNGNWDPEPGGWPRLSAILHNIDKTELKIEPVTLGEGKLVGGPTGFAVATLTGTAKPGKFTDAQRAELKAFVSTGGRLLVDAAGGDLEFATAIEEELTATFPDKIKDLTTPLPNTDALFAATGAGAKPLEMTVRSYGRKKGLSPNQPRLLGVRQGTQLSILYSPADLSGGLVGPPTDGIRGFTPQAATELVRRFLLQPTK